MKNHRMCMGLLRARNNKETPTAEAHLSSVKHSGCPATNFAERVNNAKARIIVPLRARLPASAAFGAEVSCGRPHVFKFSVSWGLFANLAKPFSRVHVWPQEKSVESKFGVRGVPCRLETFFGCVGMKKWVRDIT